MHGRTLGASSPVPCTSDWARWRQSIRMGAVGMSTALSLLVLAAVLVFAVIRPRGLPEVVAALPGAVMVWVLGLVSWRDITRELAALGPTVAFLAAVLMLAH